MIFLDSPSTTPLDASVFEAMLPYLQPTAHGLHRLGQMERSGSGAAVRSARESVADLIGCLPNEIVWTSGATEANNLAILGFARWRAESGRIVTQRTEHSAVLEPVRYLQSVGWEVELLPVDERGRVSLDEIEKAVAKKTDLVSIMWGNNEIGTLQPIAEIAELCEDREIELHCDAAQAVGKLPINLADVPVSMLTVSAHKFYGPQGVGALFVRDLSKRKKVLPLLFGGGQEHGLRPGTLNVPAIVGLGTACRLAKDNMREWSQKSRHLREFFEAQLIKRLSDVSINGDINDRLPHISNIAFYGTDNEGLLTMLPEIIASTGSACHVADFHPSHVLIALNKTPEVTQCSLRFGFSKDNTLEEVQRAVDLIVDSVNEYRANG